MYCLLLSLLFSLPLLAHQSSTTSSGNHLYWANKNIPLEISSNTSDLSSSSVSSLILNSMNEWNLASTAKVNPSSTSANHIKFTHDFSIYGSAVIGLTEINYNSSGAIQKATILLNDNFVFTSNPNTVDTGTIYLGDVVTHELGHFLGLDHSEVLKSSMFYTSFPGQSTLADDDRSGIKQKYGASLGRIHGKVLGGNHIGVLGVHVQAISRKTGETIGTVTDETGYFSLSGLELNNSYYLYTSPIKKIDSLSGYYANVQNEFCPGSYVGSFFTPCGSDHDGYPQPLALTASKATLDVGSVSINCSLRANNDYSYQKVQTIFNPISIWESYENAIREKAFVGYFTQTASWSKWETLKADLSGIPLSAFSSSFLNLKLIANQFGNLMEYQMRVYQDGLLIADKTISPSFLGIYENDLSVSSLLSANASENNFEIEIRARKLTSSLVDKTFPSPSQFTTESHMPYLLLLGISEGSTATSATPVLNNVQFLSDNDSCLDAPFTYQVNKSTVLSENGITARSDEGGPIGAACGTIDPPDSGPGSSLPLLVAGFTLSFLLGLLSKKAKNILS
jgi:hypothetical protein